MFYLEYFQNIRDYRNTHGNSSATNTWHDFISHEKRHGEVKRTVKLAATKWLFRMLSPILKGAKKNTLHEIIKKSGPKAKPKLFDPVFAPEEQNL